LTYGSQPVALNYHFLGSPPLQQSALDKYSRRGNLLTLPAKGKMIHIPGRHQGTEGDNFVTRALGGIHTFIQREIEKVIKT